MITILRIFLPLLLYPTEILAMIISEEAGLFGWKCILTRWEMPAAEPLNFAITPRNLGVQNIEAFQEGQFQVKLSDEPTTAKLPFKDDGAYTSEEESAVDKEATLSKTVPAIAFFTGNEKYFVSAGVITKDPGVLLEVLNPDYTLTLIERRINPLTLESYIAIKPIEKSYSFQGIEWQATTEKKVHSTAYVISDSDSDTSDNDEEYDSDACDELRDKIERNLGTKLFEPGDKIRKSGEFKQLKSILRSNNPAGRFDQIRFQQRNWLYHLGIEMSWNRNNMNYFLSWLFGCNLPRLKRIFVNQIRDMHRSARESSRQLRNRSALL